MFWKEKIKIGNLEVPRFMAAPLDGVTDSPFRQTLRTFSPDNLLFTEMTHVASIPHNGKRAEYEPVEHPLCFQFSANKLEHIERAEDIVVNLGYDMINLNAGCPAKNVVKNGSGSALMADMPRLKEIIQTLQKHSGGLPVTIKIRAGFKEKNAPDVVKMAEDLGVPMVIIHPRTQIDKFGGEIDYDLVQKINQDCTIPLVFSGNITSYERAQEVYDRTGVDGYMIGRAIWGCPWKMAEMQAHAEGKEFVFSLADKIRTIQEHFTRTQAHYGTSATQLFKAHLGQYFSEIKEIGSAKAMHDYFLRETDHEAFEAKIANLNADSVLAANKE
jgi:tRNA-dihydrouridine synthase B